MKKFADGEKRMSSLEDTTTQLKSDMAEVKTAIIGDYEKPGLKTIAIDNKKDLGEMKVHMEKIGENKRDWARWAERLVYSAMFGLIIYMIKQGLK